MPAIVFVLFLLVGVASAQPAEEDADAEPAPAGSNVMCPVMKKERALAKYSTEHEGRRVYFCCKSCASRFKRNPERYLVPLEPEGAARLARFLGNFHPAVVHFPLGLLVAAALAELLLQLRGARELARAGTFCVSLGAVTATLGAILGWLEAPFAGAGETYAGALLWHRILGTSTAVLSLIAWWLIRRETPEEQGRTAYRCALYGAAATVLVTGFLGGVLVYGWDHYSW